MIIRLRRRKGSQLTLTVDHVIYQVEAGKSDWIQVFGLPTRMDNSFLCESLAWVGVYDYGRLIWEKNFMNMNPAEVVPIGGK